MSRVTAFKDGKKIASGEREEVAIALHKVLLEQDGTILVFEDSSGRVTDLDYRNVAPRKAGRPKIPRPLNDTEEQPKLQTGAFESL